MKNFLQFAAGAALLALAVLCGFGCWGVVATVRADRQVAAAAADAANQAAAAGRGTTAAAAKIGALADAARDILTDSRLQVAASLGRLSDAASNLDQASKQFAQASAELVAPCAAGKPCGTLADVNRTLASFRLAAGQVTAVSLKEQSKLDQANQQETTLALGAQRDVQQLGDAIGAFKDLVNDQDLHASLASLNTSLGAVAGMATDTQKVWHKFLHPSWPHRVWGAVKGAGVTAAKVLLP